MFLIEFQQYFEKMYSYSIAFKQNHYNCSEEKIVLLIDSAKIAEREGPFKILLCNSSGGNLLRQIGI